MTGTLRPDPASGARVRPSCLSDAHETEAARWPGAWVRERLDITLTTTSSPVGLTLEQLVGLAVRRNARRAHLLVSSVLGKHVPTDPRIVDGAGRLLGHLVADVVAGRTRSLHAHGRLLGRALAGDGAASAQLLTATRPLAVLAPDGTTTDDGGRVDHVGPARGSECEIAVLGFAETATALGHAVAEVLGAPYLHSTRRPVRGVAPMGAFEEEHSHATSHLLLPEDSAPFDEARLVVLVDDELTSGTTAVNTIRALHAARPRARYLVASLVDLRSGPDLARMDQIAGELGAPIDVVALVAGRVLLPPDVLERAASVIAASGDSTRPETQPGRTRALATGARASRTVRVQRLDGRWPRDVKEGGRHGFLPRDRPALEEGASSVAEAVRERLAPGTRLHVLGFEELMYTPLRIACRLADTHPVTFSTTTRSPVLAVDEPGYAIRSVLGFPAHDDPADGPGRRYAYNVPADAGAVLLVVDEPADTQELSAPGGLLALLGAAGRQVVLVTVPSHTPVPDSGRTAG